MGARPRHPLSSPEADKAAKKSFFILQHVTCMMRDVYDADHHPPIDSFASRSRSFQPFFPVSHILERASPHHVC